MKQNEKLTELNKMMSASGLDLTLEILKTTLQKYQQLEFITKHRYTIRFEFESTLNKISQLEQKIDDLVKLSENWEKLV